MVLDWFSERDLTGEQLRSGHSVTHPFLYEALGAEASREGVFART
jgi:hypothetical protein